MSQDTDFSRHSDYFEARAVEERRMAMAAKDTHVREIHLDMAKRYAEAALAGKNAPFDHAEDPRQVG
jgi:hypothetical protein